MPITHIGPYCSRRGCRGPALREGLCPRCWRLARFFGKDPQLFAYEPVDGYRHDRDAAELPWDRWAQEAKARGLGVADLFQAPPERRPEA